MSATPDDPPAAAGHTEGPGPSSVEAGPSTLERDRPEPTGDPAGSPTHALPAPPTPAGSGIPDGRDHLTESIAELKQQLEALQRGFDAKIKYDASKEKVIDALHRELQAYREDLQFKLVRPLLLDLIAMYDDLDSLIQHAQTYEVSSESERRLRRSVVTFVGTLEEILARYGVEAYRVEGDAVAPQRQRSIKRIDTDRVELDRRVAARLRPGFLHHDHVLRPELVATFHYIAPRPPADADRSS